MLMPSFILKQIFNPKTFEEAFKAYLKLGDASFETSKTLQPVVYQHARALGATNNASFFDGDGAVSNTSLNNMTGENFVRPNTEHALIYAIRLADGIGADLTAISFTPGLTASPQIANGQMTVQTNSQVALKKYIPSESLSGLTTRDQGIIMLSQPIWWLGQTDLEFSFATANGANTPANYALEVKLLGLGYR